MGDVGKIGLGIATGGLSTVATGIPGAPGMLGSGLAGGKDGGPTPPDFTAAANEAAKQSKVNTSNPFSSSSWSQGPDGRWSQSTQLGGGLGKAAAGLSAQAGGLSTPMDWSKFGPAQTGDQARDQAITGAYNQATSRLDPQWNQRGDALTAQLANQGLSAQDEAGGHALEQFGRDRNDAYSSAMNGAIAQGTAAGDSTFRNNMLSRSTSIADALRQRSQPIDEMKQIQGFMTGNQAPGVATGPNLLGAAEAAYGGELQKYGINQQGKNSMMSGAAQLAPLLLL